MVCWIPWNSPKFKETDFQLLYFRETSWLKSGVRTVSPTAFFRITSICLRLLISNSFHNGAFIGYIIYDLPRRRFEYHHFSCYWIICSPEKLPDNVFLFFLAKKSECYLYLGGCANIPLVITFESLVVALHCISLFRTFETRCLK